MVHIFFLLGKYAVQYKNNLMRKVPLIREITLAVTNYRSVLLQKSDITNMDIIPGNSDFTV